MVENLRRLSDENQTRANKFDGLRSSQLIRGSTRAPVFIFIEDYK